MSDLPDKTPAIVSGLDAAGIPYAIGGELALAWCTERVRDTIHIGGNGFVEPGNVR